MIYALKNSACRNIIYLEYVDGRMGDGEPVPEGAVVVLQYRRIIVQHRQRVPRVAQKRAVSSCKKTHLYHGTAKF